MSTSSPVAAAMSWATSRIRSLDVSSKPLMPAARTRIALIGIGSSEIWAKPQG